MRLMFALCRLGLNLALAVSSFPLAGAARNGVAASFKAFTDGINDPSSAVHNQAGFYYLSRVQPQPGGFFFTEQPMFDCGGGTFREYAADCPAGSGKRIAVGWVFLISGLLALCCGFLLWGQWCELACHACCLLPLLSI